MEEYESNSLKSKEDGKNPQKEKLEKVVKGDAKKSKKTGFRKFLDLFVAEDADSVKTYIFNDVVIPKIKEMAVSIVDDGINMIFYGKSSGDKSNNYGHKSSYQKYYEEKNKSSNYIQESRTAYNFENVIIPSRGEAEMVIDQMKELINRYDTVSVSDFYYIVDVDDNNYVNNDWGWDNLDRATIIRRKEGWEVSLPRPKYLND